MNVIMKRLLGEPYYQAKQVRSEDEEEEEEVAATVEEEYQEHPVEVDMGVRLIKGDSTKERAWGEVAAITKEMLETHNIKRVHVVTSPPWGVLQGQTSDGQDDAALTPSSIGEVSDDNV